MLWLPNKKQNKTNYKTQFPINSILKNKSKQNLKNKKAIKTFQDWVEEVLKIKGLYWNKGKVPSTFETHTMVWGMYRI
jgi:hypothetical protein